MDDFHGPMAVEYEQDGRRRVTGGLSAAFLDEHVLPAMKGLGCAITRVYDAVAEAQETFPPGTRVLSRTCHPALNNWLGTVTGEYRPDSAGGCSVAVDWDDHGTDRDWPVTWLTPLKGEN